MDKIEFHNIYDIMHKVLKGVEGKVEPLKGLGQKPNLDRYIRDYETAINQVVQTLPLIEPGRPRRGFQQENMLNLLTRTSDIYAGEKPSELGPEAQKELIKDLNVRLNEMMRESYFTNKKLAKEGIRTVSTLGVPEALASKVQFFRPEGGEATKKFLNSLDAVSTKMYTDIIPELAPFGAQFTQAGRQVASITNAISASKVELDRLAEELKGTTLEGYGTEYPSLRTSRESELISAGRFGNKGYGFNVLTELRHTAGTMEDQILVSGNLANALTSITKTLVRPSPAGRLSGGLSTAPGISDLQPGPVKDKDIQNVLRQIQEVLGVPEHYKGRADQAFIDEIKKVITVIRGEEVEVQQARLTEVFLNAFGRKFTSRYGSKGVSVTPTGLDEGASNSVLKTLQDFPKATIKVLTEKERKQAGLGVAMLPRSAGELFSEVIDKYQKQLESEGFDVSLLRKMLIASGNKFVLDIFKDAKNAIVIPEEAAEQRRVFERASEIFKSITGESLSGGQSSIKQIKDLFTKEIGGALTKERAIDVRISSVGIGKRGLQPEVLEAVVNNIAAVGERGFTTLPTKFSKEQYERLLGKTGKPGELSKVSKGLGFETLGTEAEIRAVANVLGTEKGKDSDMAKVIAKRAEALEAMSNYYTTVVDEFGKKRKSLVGEKFLSIVQETGETEAWSKEDIRRGIKGASIDIPVFSAYSTVFGEQSKLIRELLESVDTNQRKQIEFLKTLQFMADETGTLQARQTGYLDKVDLNAVKYFDESSGILEGLEDALDPRSLKNTVFDVKKFPKPFFLNIPKTSGTAGETEPFYVPGALARGTYAEELVGGERGVENIGRRLQHVVNMAKQATELLDRPATIRGEIEALEAELDKLKAAGDPRAAQVETQLLSRRTAETRMLSGEGQLPDTVRRRVIEEVGDFLKEAQNLRFDKTPQANDRVKEIYSILTNALSRVEAPAEAFRVKRGVNLQPGASEFENVQGFLNRQLGKKEETAAYADAIGKAADLLIGKGPGAQDVYNTIIKGIAELQQGDITNIEQFKKVLLQDFSFRKRVTGDPGNILKLLQEKQRYMQNEMRATENKLYRLAKDVSSGRGLELAARLGIDIDKELQFKYEKVLDNLQKAKIDYFHALADAAVGKKGAIGQAVFSRKYPAVMKKATNAIVDKTGEFEKFKEALNQIKGSLPEDNVSTINDVLADISKIAGEHKKKIAVQKRAGFPVLRQQEIGIPEITAKKLPVEFKKRFEFTKDTVSLVKGKIQDTEGTLYDLLKYIQNLKKMMGGYYDLKDSDNIEKIQSMVEKELEELSPYVEAIRYPFTGISSIVPYKAKLLEGSMGKKAKNSFVVPGAPELDFSRFSKAVKPVEDIISQLSMQREEIFKQADITGTQVDYDKVKDLTSLIEQLAAAVAEVTPKYAAHTAKLDFDGDEIAVHTAKTKEARQEIESHYDSLVKFDKGLQSVYRNFFTSDALKSQQPTGQAILAEMAESFYKKFPKEKGFEFLVRPFLTGQVSLDAAASPEDILKTPTLEYAGRGEQLSILGLGEGIVNTLEDVIHDTIQGPKKEDLISALEPFKELEKGLGDVKKSGMLEKRVSFIEDIYKAIEDLDKDLSTAFVEQIKSAITSRLFESKYRDAVEAQLFKIHTGIETEAMYRLNRLVESNLGYGGGFVKTGKPFRFDAGFSKRNPNLKILGGGQQPIAEDFYAKFNEVFRFALQKGMDVKHAGGRSVSSEIERQLARGAEGVKSLWDSIVNDTDEVFGELKDFSDNIDKVIKLRLGELSTKTIKEELVSLYEARGVDYKPTDIAKADRDEIVGMALEATGLKSFFEEMSIQIRDAAIEGVIKNISTLSPEKRSRIGDPREYAKKLISDEMKKSGINVREHIIAPKLPLYNLRQSSNMREQVGRYMSKYGEPDIPGNIKFLRKGPKETEEILEKYKAAKAVSKNIQDAFNEAVRSEGRGAYSDLVKSTLDNIHNDQLKIEHEFERLKSEGFDINKVDRGLNNLVDRVLEQKDIPGITKEILKKSPDRQAAEIERLSDLVGIPTLTREEKMGVSKNLLQDIRKKAEVLYSEKPDISKEEINKLVEEYTNKVAAKATIVYEMDRIIDVLGTRAKEGITLLSLFPESGTALDVPKLKKSYSFAQQMKDVAQKGQAMREVDRRFYGPTGPGAGFTGPGIPPIGGGMPPTGPLSFTSGVVPVHIHSIAQGIGVFFGSGEAGPASNAPKLNPELQAHQKLKSDVEAYRNLLDQHSEVSIKKSQEELKKLKGKSSGFDPFASKFGTEEFTKVQKKYFPGMDPSNYMQLKSAFFTDLMNVFSASRFKGGGVDVKDLLKGKRYESQVEGIISNILGLDKDQIDESTQAAFDLGTALHAKLQRKIMTEAKTAGKEGQVEVEKFVFLKPKDFVEGIKGPITGFIDVAYKNAQGQIERISDIKTTGETFAKFETLSRAIPKEGIELSELLNKDIPARIKQKLEDYRSQLNVYLAALIKSGQASKDIKATIDFIPSEDIGLGTEPLSISFGFDESRLKQDLGALKTAREIISNYIQDTSKTIEEVPEEHRGLVGKLRRKVGGISPAAGRARNLRSYLLEEELGKVFEKPEFTETEEFATLAKNVFEFTQGKSSVYDKEREKFKKAQAVAETTGQPLKSAPDIPNIDPSRFPKAPHQTVEERTRSKAKVQAFIEPLKEQFKAIESFHRGSVALQTEIGGLDFDKALSGMHADIQEALPKGKKPPTGPEFLQLLETLREGDFIDFKESMDAWKLWRIATGDFLIAQAREAEQVFDIAKSRGVATREFASFQKRVEDVRSYIVKSLGKRSDIYTRDRRFLLPEQAKEAGVFATPRQLFEQAKLPFGEDEFTRGIYRDLLDKLESGTLKAPAEEIRKLVDQLADVDEKAKRVLESATLFERQGKDATEAWDFEKVAKRAQVLREALAQYAKFNLSDEFQTDVEKKFQVRSLLQYLKQIEQTYGKLDMDRLQSGPLGQYETGAVKIPRFLPPKQQEALNRRNIQKFRELMVRPEDQGGAAIGESFSYFSKVVDQAGNIVRNVRVDFKKYGEVLDENKNKVGKFSESHTDLIDKMHMAGGTFRSATRRVIMWGAAATLVYGGVQALKDSIGELAEIELGLAQLRMVMNPLTTDFGSLQKSAVDFAKTYGVAVKSVIAGMKIFAQQGLKQSEVVDRTRVSTLAANVSTLSAAEATEALTAAMKSYGSELGTADMALDAWSETEARHAVTAADMANAIKKSAAAAKNAGFTFNELNGIVAGIGSVTRQTGKEVGTAVRFIARRMFSEKGPNALADIGIPTVTGTGENRRGFDILSDLATKWDELTNAQKLNIAQSLGGTRQYNSLLVAMDNWNEVLDAIEDSTNSKGSAERRNLEVMKTYSKQLEQTKAAATELKMELGKFTFPIFKTGLKSLKLLFEFMSAIPTPVKAAGIALGLFFTYASKGLTIFDTLEGSLSKGISIVRNFINSVRAEFVKSNFEVLGKGFGPQLEGLKTFAKGAPEKLKASGLDDLHSGFGKLIFVIKDVGDAWNKVLATGGMGMKSTGNTISDLGAKFKNTATIIDYLTDLLQASTILTPGIQDDLIAAGTQMVEWVARGSGKATEKFGEYFGKTGEKIAAFLSDADPGLFKSIAPLAATIGASIYAFNSFSGSIDRARKTAQEYAQSVYNSRRVEEDQIKDLTNLTRQYDRLEQKLKKISNVMKTPDLKEKQQESGNYTSPLLALASVQEDAIRLANELAQVNNRVVSGYDEHGNAILRLTGNYKSYIESLQKASSLELAKTDIDVLKKYVESLTDTGLGETVKRTLKTALGEVPGFGGLLKDLVSVSPGKEMEVLTGQLNNLLSTREKYPLTDVFDEDISKLQDALGKVKKVYDETVSDFKKALAGIFKFEGAKNLDRDTIARLLSDPGLKKGFDLLIEVEPKIAEVNRTRFVEKVKPEDLVGSEILKRVFPEKKVFIDYTSELTAAQLESAGIIAREGKKVASGDIVTFFPELAKLYNIAGSQAVVELKKTTDGVYEAFITYINSKTLAIEQRPLDDPNLMKLVDRIFPSGRIQTELENRLDALNTFVSGAAAGLVGIEPKKFKKDFDLGARFYSELPTTTVLQANKGFNIQSGQFGAMPQLQQEWAKMTKDFFIEPMIKYNREIENLSKNTLDGLEDAAQLTRQKADELYDQQAILRNNQVVTQFAAVFADLSKTMEDSSRTLRENLAVEKARQESVRITTGLLKGMPEGFDAIDTGIRRVQDLSVKQIAALSSPGYNKLAGQARNQGVIRSAAISEMEALEKAKAAIETIYKTQAGLGSIVGPESGPKAVEGFINKVVATQDVGMATLSHDINNLDTTSRKGFGDVVDRLETMIANQGDYSGLYENISNLNSIANKGFVNKRESDMFGVKIAQEIHKIAGKRAIAENKGDQQAVGILNSYLDQLSDIMVKTAGVNKGAEYIRRSTFSPAFSSSGRYELSTDEFKQRVFRKIQPNELIERFKVEGSREPRSPSAIENLGFPFITAISKAINGPLKKEFAKSGEYKDLISLQKDANKLREKALLDSKTILKGSVAIATFEAFNKKYSNKTLDKLKEQLKTEEETLASVNKTGKGDTSGLEKSIATYKKAIKDEEASLKFHGLVSTLTKMTGATTALAKAIGVSETNLKRMNVGAVGLYLAMQAASKVTGKDMPDSAKEFGDVLKDAINEFKDSGDISRSTFGKIKDSGKKFQDAYGDRVKEATGQTKEFIDEQIGQRINGLKKLSEAEINARAKALRKDTKSGNFSNAKALIAALTASTFAGTFYEMSGRGTADAELERLASKTSDIYNRIIEKYPEAAETIAKELVMQVKDRAKDIGTNADKDAQNQLLDVTNEYNKAIGFLDESINKTKETIKETSGSFSELADQMYKFELISDLSKSTRDFVRNLSYAAAEFENRRFFSGPAILNKNLSGFPGEVELPIQRRQLSTQQRLFSDLGTEFKGAVAAYSYGLQTINEYTNRLTELHKKRRDFIEDDVKDVDAWEKLDDEIKLTKDSINNTTETLRGFGTALSNVNAYAEAVNKLNDAFNDIAIKQAVETIPGFVRYRENMDKLFGGGHPEAAIGITPEQERLGRSVGVQLKHMQSNRYDLERVQLLERLRTSTGQERRRAAYQLQDLPEARRRQMEEYQQRTETTRLREQLAPYEQALVDIQKLRQTSNLTDEVDKSLKDYQTSIINMLQNASQSLSRKDLANEVIEAARKGLITEDQAKAELTRIVTSGPKQFRGTLVTGTAEIDKKRLEVYEALRGELPTREMIDMKAAVTNPIVKELNYQTQILKTIAEKGLDIDSDALARPIVKPFAETSFEAPRKGFFEKLFGKSSGGRVFGEGGPKEDKVPAMLSPGEYVIKAASAAKLGMNALEYLNKHGQLPEEYAEGGIIETIKNIIKGKPKKLSEKEVAELIKTKSGSGYLTNRSLKRAMLDAADPNNLAEGGIVDKIKSWVKGTPKKLSEKEVAKAIQEKSGTGYMANKSLKKAMLDAAGNYREGGVFETAGDFWHKLIGNMTEKRMGLVDEYSDMLKGKKGNAAGNILGQLGLILGEVGSKSVKGIIDLFGLLESGVESATDAISEKGLDVAVYDFNKKIGSLSRDVSSGKIGEKLYDFVESGGMDKIKETLGQGVKKGTLFTSVSSLATDLATGAGATKYLKYAKLDRFMSEFVGPVSKSGVPKNVNFAIADDLLKNRLFKEYPDIAEKIGKVKYTKKRLLPHEQGEFTASSVDKTRLTETSPYKLFFNKNILKGNPSEVMSVVRHEFAHGIEQYVRDSFLSMLYGTSQGPKDIGAFTKMYNFIESFGKRAPVSRYAARVGVEKPEKFLTENFAEFVRKVQQGAIKGEEAAKFKKLFNPKYFQTGQTFAEGGIVDKIKNWIKGAPKKLSKKEVAELIKKRSGSGYLTDKSLKKAMLDAADPNNLAEGGPVRKFTTVNGEIVEVDEKGNVIKNFSKELDDLSKRPKDSFLMNKAYELGLGETEISPKRVMPQATFAEESMSKTAKRFGEEATKLHRARYKLTDEEISRARDAELNRQQEWFVLKDENVQRMLRDYGTDKVGPYDAAIKMAYGLDKKKFILDRRRGVTTFEDLPGGMVTYRDLREDRFQALKFVSNLSKMAGVDEYKPKVPADFVTTPGEDYDTKKALEQAAINKKALRDRLFNVKPGDKLFREAGSHYGRETELLLPIYHKIKTIIEKDKSTDPKILKQFDQASSLLRKGALNKPADLKLLGDLVRADKEGAFIRSDVEETPNIVGLQKVIDKAKGLQKLNAIKEIISSLDDNPTLAKELIKNLNRKADGGSMPFFQSGGPITKSGPIYAHKGEYVLQKGFAEGGLVDGSVMSASLREGSIKLEDNGLADKIADKIKEAIESSEIKIEDAKVKVDTTDARVPIDIGDYKVPVDTTNAKVGVDVSQASVPVDIGTASSAIGDAIKQALANATVDVNVNQAGAVGATNIDVVSNSVREVQDKLITVRDELDLKIESIKTEMYNSNKSEIATQINNAITRVQQDINEHRTDISLMNGKITRFEQQTDYRLREVDRLAKDAQNLAQRPPTNFRI
jgi:TP901 family phage tail tape measure protein